LADDDSDLFAATQTDAAAKVPPPLAPAPPPAPAERVRAAGAPRAAPEVHPGAPRAEKPPPPAAPAAAPAPARQVVEFADEVVEVRRASAPANEQTAGKAVAAPPNAAMTASSRILQFHKQGPGSGGLLGDDLAQMGGGQRLLLIAFVVALGCGIAYAVMRAAG
jgi:hypothetical protein